MEKVENFTVHGFEFVTYVSESGIYKTVFVSGFGFGRSDCRVEFS
jgi:hypothetical protein